MSDRIAELKAKKAALEKRIRKEQNKLKAKERKTETRRKILKGAALDIALSKNVIDISIYEQILDEGVTSDRDRDALGLPPRESSR